MRPAPAAPHPPASRCGAAAGNSAGWGWVRSRGMGDGILWVGCGQVGVVGWGRRQRNVAPVPCHRPGGVGALTRRWAGDRVGVGAGEIARAGRWPPPGGVWGACVLGGSDASPMRDQRGAFRCHARRSGRAWAAPGQWVSSATSPAPCPPTGAGSHPDRSMPVGTRLKTARGAAKAQRPSGCRDEDSQGRGGEGPLPQYQ